MLGLSYLCVCRKGLVVPQLKQHILNITNHPVLIHTRSVHGTSPPSVRHGNQEFEVLLARLAWVVEYQVVTSHPLEPVQNLCGH